MRVFARNLTWIMDANGISQNELARKSGVTQSHISSLRRDLRRPYLGTIYKLHRGLHRLGVDVSYDDLLVDRRDRRRQGTGHFKNK